jgi:hypothetical protein
MAIKDLFLCGVRRTWTILDDFAPKQTIDEFARLINDFRSQTFDVANYESRMQLEARAVAVQQAASIMAQTGAPVEALAVAKEEASLIDTLLTMPGFERDVLAGSLSSEREIGREWQRVQNQTGTAVFFARLGRNTVAPLFEDQKLRDDNIQLRTMLRARKEALIEVRKLLAPENRKVIDTKLTALDRVDAAVVEAKREREKVVS